MDELRRDRNYAGQIVHVEELPGRDAAFGELAAPLEPRLREALRTGGIHRFYSHQAHAINAARGGENVVTVTSTASGKTMCYNVPVLDGILRRPRSRALYLFPTKALAQDQLGKLRGFNLDPFVSAATFDGDTPKDDRRAIKQKCGIVLTNPDMLSLSILPYHQTWGTFFRSLQYIVIDEVHSYRGVFGSHVGNVLRRLRRVCEQYGARPQFLCCSATIANPEELVRKLTGIDAALVDEDGSPSGPKRFVFWNPPIIANDNAARRSTNVETTGLFSSLVKDGIRTIAFARARQTAELILRYTRSDLGLSGLGLSDKITSYRAGYMAEERRQIERRLFNGDLLGVVSTNALELGVDIGGLDACILNGFPGTVASTWQQAGRAGRGQQESLAIMVAQDNPLDQYLMNRPSYFFGRPHEHAIVDPENLHILRGHLRAAAYEVPLTDADTRYFGLGMHLALTELVEAGELRVVGGPPSPALLPPSLAPPPAGGEPDAETPHPLAPSPLGGEGEPEWQPPLTPPSEEGGPDARVEGLRHETPAPPPPGEVGRGQIWKSTVSQTGDALPQPLPEGGGPDVHPDGLRREPPVPLLPKEGQGEVSGPVPPLPQGERGLGSEGYRRPAPPARYLYAGNTYPAGDINIRSASNDAFQIVERRGRLIGTEEMSKVFHTLHPGAMYLHMGDSFLVEELDVATKTAWVNRTDATYYTQPRDTSHVEIVETAQSKRMGRAQAYFGPVTVTNQVIGYKRKQHFTDTVQAMVELDLPPLTFDTEAMWFVVPTWAVEELAQENVDIPGGLHAIEHATIGLMPLYAMCDRNDIGGVSYPRHPALALPAIFIHDAHPGGVGITERCFDIMEPLLKSTRDHIAACPCADGCPSCIQSPKCGNNNEPLDKDAALRILNLLLGGG